MRLIDIADGFTSNTQPSIGALTASKLVQYISDGAYETANGTPIGGEIYFNTTNGTVRVYDNTGSTWETIGQTVIGWQESPSGTVNGINTVFNITYAPINDKALLVYIDGVLSRFNDFTYSSGVITFSTPPQVGQQIYCTYITEGFQATPSLIISGQFVEYKLLTGIDISAKQITLSNTPAENTKVILDWVGTSTQIYGQDYIVSGNVLSWNGLGLDGELMTGDNLRIFYLIF